MTEVKVRPFECWDDFKKYRMEYYKNYLEAKEKGGIRWAGSAWAFDPVPAGLGEDVYPLTGEPYGATCAFFRDFSYRALEAIERKGVARDLCGYMRNYWGSIVLDKYLLADGTEVEPFPKPDFNFTIHICCTHAKWYHYAAELEGGVPTYAVDISVGPGYLLDDKKIEYVVRQLEDAIQWMEKVTGREYDDELLIKAVENEAKSMTLWAKICKLNQATPAPMEEKSMFSFYVLTLLKRSDEKVVKLYEKLYKEVESRVKRGIGALTYEQFRFVTDNPPPWPFLKVYRYLEQTYGAVSVGSIYTFGLGGAWKCMDEKGEKWVWEPAPTPEEVGYEIHDRRSALWWTAMFNLKYRASWQHEYSHRIRKLETYQMIKDWKVDAIIMHLNRGCELWNMSTLEVRDYLVKQGVPVATYEGNMADPREFDEARTFNVIDSFMQSLGVEKLA
ncbi:benzoyl-CoA reductase, bzd-type, O subunit [Ferroglobus placidus DSM 10642]|uniref:Benzoyl-CoA reductase, bzd-type, O subunit n=1 Tax=Ferroglobus placidus (strain DSM 10642 / AEDII12DO) TaxID=589924 RepID=D3RXY0_FERPA|nr:benzoyl-CoA reductase, bzd-type, subunit O [Ferroglobus placidus]ADC65343.1 benzoyl-CoA reductase, bzd-type, O subunit [Ferroglobus placidus DSM 10642]QCO91680.1 bzd-type benzoyl-CoA reductase subunit O [synthetic construct]